MDGGTAYNLAARTQDTCCWPFYALLYCTGLGFQANIVEEYVLMSALKHIFTGLKRTRDQKLSSGLMSCQIDFGCHSVDWHTLLEEDPVAHFVILPIYQEDVTVLGDS